MGHTECKANGDIQSQKKKIMQEFLKASLSAALMIFVLTISGFPDSLGCGFINAALDYVFSSLLRVATWRTKWIQQVSFLVFTIYITDAFRSIQKCSSKSFIKCLSCF